MLFGLFGLACRQGGFLLMPLLMGFVIAAPVEDHLRRAIAHARGDWTVLAANPAMMAVATVAGLVILARSLVGRPPARH